MDILSFVLGIAVVVVIGLSIVAVIAFVKAKKIEKQLENVESHIFRILQSEISDTHLKIDEVEKGTHQLIDEVEKGTHQRIDELENNVFSQMDSRLDKLENKLTTKK
jgi:replicative DNA helicase